MKEKEMERIADLIADVLAAPADIAVGKRVEAEVRSLCDAFPLYAARLAAYTRG